MTDKEWTELCDWVRTLEKMAFVCIDKDRIIVESLEFTKYGNIECNYGEYCLVENRSAKQIKSIIKNLIRKVEK